MPGSTARTTGTLQNTAHKPVPPSLGFGLGLRAQHYNDILTGTPDVDWFEFISENYLVPGGQPLAMLDRVAERYPLVMHGVSMSIASTTPFNEDYLDGLVRLAKRTNPKWVSDHLCWTGVHGINLHDLLPFPYSREALDHVVSRVHYVQERLGRPLCLENVSTYVTFEESEMAEWEFIAEMAERTGCWLLFDVNNVYVSAHNHGWDANAFMLGIPADRVVQFHLAGHSDMGTHIIDTHDAAVCDGVWDLYEVALRRFGPVSTMIERDDNIPPLADLVDELAIARARAERVLGHTMRSPARGAGVTAAAG
ncbi:MAG: MNIO family bufferin maturase [Hyphomicrobium sp.]